MDPALTLRGFVLGFTIAAAVGPISLLVIRRTLAEGQVVGLASGLGVATADATYGAIAAFGLGAITQVLVEARHLLGLVGGLFLLWLAWKTARAEPHDPAVVRPRRGGLAGAYLSILGLTLTNPMTILSFGALFAGLGVDERRARRRRPGHARRPAGLGCLVGAADLGRVGAAGADHDELDPADQPGVRDCDRGVRAVRDRDGGGVGAAAAQASGAGCASEKSVS